MKPSRDVLIDWVQKLGVGRENLPYELVKVFAESEEAELEGAFAVAFDHLERVLGFKSFCDHGSGDADDLWVDLQAALDDYSYFACMSLPLVRQILEPSSGFIYEAPPDLLGLKNFSIQTSMAGKNHASLSLPQREIYDEAVGVSEALTELSRAYEELATPEALREWCTYFLGYAGRIIVLASKMSLTNVAE